MREEKARPWLTLEQPVCAECHPGRRTLLQVRGYVSKRGGGKVSPGCDPGPRERKAQEAGTLPQQFFPNAREPSPKALLGRSSEGLFAPSGKISAKAQHSLGSKSWVFGWLLLTRAKRSAGRCETSPERNLLCPDIPTARERSVLAPVVAALRKGSSLSPRPPELFCGDRVTQLPEHRGALGIAVGKLT